MAIEYKDKGHGWLADTPDYRDYPFKAAPPVIRALPPRVSLRDRHPKIYDQGQLGSCTSQGILAMFDYVRKKHGQKFMTPSRLFTYFNSRIPIGTTNSDSGAMPRDAIKSVVNDGCCREISWLYRIEKFKIKPSAALYRQAEHYQAIEYFRIKDGVLNLLKACLAEDYPFVFGAALYTSFYDTKRDGMVPMPSGHKEGNHLMEVTGYDDAIQMFEVRNSWSTAFADRGYCFMPYPYLGSTGLCSDFWTIRSTEIHPLVA